MNKTTKFIYLSLFFSFSIICVYFFVVDVKGLIDMLEIYNNNEAIEEILSAYIIRIIYSLLGLTVCFMQLVFILKNTNLSNFTKYTYEEYKKMLDKKKTEKQVKNKQQKIEILKQQLNELEKGD